MQSIKLGEIIYPGIGTIKKVCLGKAVRLILTEAGEVFYQKEKFNGRFLADSPHEEYGFKELKRDWFGLNETETIEDIACNFTMWAIVTSEGRCLYCADGLLDTTEFIKVNEHTKELGFPERVKVKNVWLN